MFLCSRSLIQKLTSNGVTGSERDGRTVMILITDYAEQWSSRVEGRVANRRGEPLTDRMLNTAGRSPDIQDIAHLTFPFDPDGGRRFLMREADRDTEQGDAVF